MADWRQIQARIRKAKASTDAPAQLAALYEHTRDAMVAFELAQWQEKAGEHGEAARWYASAAEKFRRAQWRTKAEEALQRLGAPVPVYSPESARLKTGQSNEAGSEAAKLAEGAGSDSSAGGDTAKSDESSDVEVEVVLVSVTDPERQEQEEEIAQESADLAENSDQSAISASPGNSVEGAQAAPSGEVKKRRRRGRRGGRKRHTNAAANANAAPGSQAKSASTRTISQPATRSGASLAPDSQPRETSVPPAPASTRASRERVSAESDSEPVSKERASEHVSAPTRVGRMRAGEPAIASRISQLESQLRRLLACQLTSLEEADQAPAGPGVLLLSDTDQVTHYYIEACQTLRIGIGNLLRGGRGSKDSGLLKQRMAENLGIGEARVGRYLNEHCAVRWLQLDEGAADLAHFAIAVLRPVVND